MVSRGYKGSAHVVIAIVIVVAIVGALGYVLWKNFSHDNKDTVTPVNSASKEVSSDAILRTIGTALRDLPHRTNIESTQGMDIPLDQPSTTVTLYEYPVNVVYNGSIFAGTNNTPLGVTLEDTDTINAASEQALNKQKVATILEENGLALTHRGDERKSPTNDLYESDKVVCQVADSLGLASVRCAAASYVARAKTNIKAAYAALLAQYQRRSIKVYISSYYEGVPDENIYGAYFSFGVERELTDFDAYMAKTPSKDWYYLASSTMGVQSVIEPACSVFAPAGLSNVFKRSDCQ